MDDRKIGREGFPEVDFAGSTKPFLLFRELDTAREEGLTAEDLKCAVWPEGVNNSNFSHAKEAANETIAHLNLEIVKVNDRWRIRTFDS